MRPAQSRPFAVSGGGIKTGGGRTGFGRRSDFNGFVNHLENPLGGGHRPLQNVVFFGQVAHRTVEALDVLQ